MAADPALKRKRMSHPKQSADPAQSPTSNDQQQDQTNGHAHPKKPRRTDVCQTVDLLLC